MDLKSLLGEFGTQSLQVYQNRLMQVLETIHLVESSNSPDTVAGRSLFLQEMFEDIVAVRTSPGFKIILQEAIDRFKQTYYDRSISERQVNIIASGDSEYIMKFCFDNLDRAFYNHIDKQLSEVGLLKREDAKSRRISKLFDFIVEQNKAILRLCNFPETAAEKDKYFDRAMCIQKLMFNYVHLKQDGFDEYVLSEANGETFSDENIAPITETARMLTKEIKSKLYGIQYLIRNQPFKIKLKVSGTNVGLALDDAADPNLVDAIKKAFS